MLFCYEDFFGPTQYCMGPHTKAIRDSLAVRPAKTRQAVGAPRGGCIRRLLAVGFRNKSLFLKEITLTGLFGIKCCKTCHFSTNVCAYLQKNDILGTNCQTAQDIIKVVFDLS